MDVLARARRRMAVAVGEVGECERERERERERGRKRPTFLLFSAGKRENHGTIRRKNDPLSGLSFAQVCIH